ncbi:MAG: acetyl-CoA carboxylase biotin carboxyl carrier protein [Verrucomicrobiales bacterium]
MGAPSSTNPRRHYRPPKNRPGGLTLDIKDIRTIIELMKRNDLTHFELEREGQKLVLKKNHDSEALAHLLSGYRAPMAPPVAVVPKVPEAVHSSAGEAEAPPAGSGGLGDGMTIKSPMVGTFYRASGPGVDVFVKVGDYVEAETTVCIIEAMKVMNEIKAEVTGRITRIAVEDATPVSYGQVLFDVKP